MKAVLLAIMLSSTEGELNDSLQRRVWDMIKRQETITYEFKYIVNERKVDER